jgi:hypothetical protein
VKIYLAAKFGQKAEMKEVRAFLINDGHEVTSQWLDVEEGVDTDAGVNRLAHYAKMDVDDVLRADVLVTFSQEHKTLHSGGGRHVEFGVAVQAGKQIIVVGPKGEHIFHYLPCVEHVADVDALAKRLHQMDREPIYD